jgi:hypothetical protein
LDQARNCAVTALKWKILLFCLRRGVDINLRGPFGDRAVNCSLRYASIKMPLFLVSSQKIDLNCATFGYDQPLFLAAQVEVIQKIYPDVELHDGADDLGTSPHSAIFNNTVGRIGLLSRSSVVDGAPQTAASFQPVSEISILQFLTLNI